jgi:hypothetical protein
VIAERLPRRLDRTDVCLHATVEQVVDHLHRVLALLVGLLVEEVGEPREGLGGVVGADRDVLVRRRELPRDLRIQRVHESLRGHASSPFARRAARRSISRHQRRSGVR